MAQVIWTPSARADLAEVREYIARDSPRYAAAMVRRIQGAVRQLGRFPECGRRVPEYPDEPYREVIAGNYRVLYRHVPERNRIVVVAVVHGRRQSRLPANGA